MVDTSTRNNVAWRGKYFFPAQNFYCCFLKTDMKNVGLAFVSKASG